jgi:hypothetical protein
MSDRMSKWKKTGWPITRRILGEVAIPGLCGIVWGIIAYYQGKTPFESISTGFAAFFFIFFLQGQVLRVAKNVGDRRHAEETRTSLVSIQEVLAEIRMGGVTKAAVEAEPYGVDTLTVTWDVPAQLMAEARFAFERDNYQSAAIAAAVAFERAVRRAAVKINVDPKPPLSDLIYSLAYSVKDMGGVHKRLRSLLSLRNSVVHRGPDSGRMSKAEAEEILDAFDEGMSILDSISFDGRDYKGPPPA